MKTDIWNAFLFGFKTFFTIPVWTLFNLVIYNKVMNVHNFTLTIFSQQNENKLYVDFREEILIFF